MDRTFAILDDSGDPGLINSSTSHFIVAAVLVLNSDSYDKLIMAMNGFRAGLGWDELDELKFSKTRKAVIKRLLKYIQQLDFKAYAIVVDKSKFTDIPKSAVDNSLYNYAIKELLIKLELSNPVIFIDGVSHKKQAERFRTYLRQHLKQHGVEKCKIRFVDSRKDVLIQLADIIAGVIARSYNNKKSKNEYLKLLKTKIEEIYEISP